MHDNVLNSERSRWPNGIVPFQLESALRVNRSLIHAAMAIISQKTSECIRFVPRSNEPVFLRILPAPRSTCSAEVGYATSSRRLQLSPECLLHDVIHELMHILGFFHEHTRPDRDEHVLIHFDNIKASKRAAYDVDYDKRTDSDTLQLPYDCRSIMHYPPSNARYAKDPNRPVMSAKPGSTCKLAPTNNMVLTDLDVQKLYTAYKCQERVLYCNLSVGQCHVYRETLTTTEKSSWLRIYAAMNKCQEKAPQRISIYCSAAATTGDLQGIGNKLQLKTDVPAYSAYIADAVISKSKFLQPIKDKVIQLGINNCQSASTTSKLRDAGLNDLLDFGLFFCYKQEIQKADFEYNSKLKRLVFHSTTMTSIEVNAFDALTELQLFQMEEYWKAREQVKVSHDTELRRHLQLIHCDCRYHWLRSWLANKPRLLSERSLDSIVPSDRGAIKVGEIYIPVSCTNVQQSVRNWKLHETTRYYNKKREPFAKNAEVSC
ncbi:uncharacterized protein LOC129590498 isoform X2 [Paramacrobiotus metropolitanus]|nr:uncharacterized protein LOC129590498 isoform X2 [Paramacrobiotus metropolitanus]